MSARIYPRSEREPRLAFFGEDYVPFTVSRVTNSVATGEIIEFTTCFFKCLVVLCVVDTVHWQGISCVRGRTMRGGARDGAGRKSAGMEKKHQRPLYISDQLYDTIMSCEISDCQSFSQKCEVLLNNAIAHYDFDKAASSVSTADGKLRFIDLFAGIGGIRKGFEDENTKAVFSSEWDKHAAATYKANYGDTPHGDITKIEARDIPKHDVLLAGFPCQPFSNIGRREGFAHATQGTLFFDVLRILKFHMPKMFLLENVAGILSIQNGETFKTILSSLKSLGYDVFWDELDAQNFGLAQIRRRVVIVGFHPKLGIKEFMLPQGDLT